jgi:hypothetical protein
MPEDSRRAAGRARAKTEATAKALVDFPSGLTLDFSKITIANLPAAKLALEIPEAAVEVDFVAAEKILRFDPVTSLGLRADSNNPSASFGRVLGLASSDIDQGRAGSIIVVGEIVNPDWRWTKGDAVFLNGTGLASAPPTSGFVQRMGTASGPTKLVVDSGEPVLL